MKKYGDTLKAMRAFLLDTGKDVSNIQKTEVGDLDCFYASIKGVRYQYVEDTHMQVHRYEA